MCVCVGVFVCVSWLCANVMLLLCTLMFDEWVDCIDTDACCLLFGDANLNEGEFANCLLDLIQIAMVCCARAEVMKLEVWCGSNRWIGSCGTSKIVVVRNTRNGQLRMVLSLVVFRS